MGAAQPHTSPVMACMSDVPFKIILVSGVPTVTHSRVSGVVKCCALVATKRRLVRFQVGLMESAVFRCVVPASVASHT